MKKVHLIKVTYFLEKRKLSVNKLYVILYIPDTSAVADPGEFRVNPLPPSRVFHLTTVGVSASAVIWSVLSDAATKGRLRVEPPVSDNKKAIPLSIWLKYRRRAFVSWSTYLWS